MSEATRVRLVVTDEDGVGTEHAVALPVTLGRDPAQADVVLADPAVSRRHARVEADDTPGSTSVVVVDLASGNGTWLGGTRVERAVVGPGEAVTIGDATIRWAPLAPPAPATPSAVDLGRAWGVVVGPDGLHHLPLADLRAAWEQLAGAVVAVARSLPAEGDDTTRLAAHERAVTALDRLLDDDLVRLGAVTVAVCAPSADPDAVATALARRRATPEHERARRGLAALRAQAAAGTTDPTVRLVLTEERRAVARVAEALRGGVVAFRTRGATAVTHPDQPLLAALRTVIAVLADADRRIAATVRASGLPEGTAPRAAPPTGAMQ